jgi:nicotinate-nucleotide adenylyltransferase
MVAFVSGVTSRFAARRIGIFGGSFDPVHNAHVALAQAALLELNLNALRWVPAGCPWQKKRSLAPGHHRAAMIQLAIENEPRFVLDPCELKREGPSYTLDTVRAMQAADPEASWFLILGQDQYAALHTWHNWPELLQRVTLAVAQRPGATQPVDPHVLAAARMSVALPMMPISSTHIRQRLSAGQSVADIVPAAVAGYIDQHLLYQEQQLGS